jgi:3,4-dihydroxy 2-butanone 4-phosphate synthase/GTP cyclohydrolase II
MGHALSLGLFSPAAKGQASFAASTDEGFEFASIDAALRELRAGRMIVVVDDEDRENEGDLTMAADMVTPEAINFMATHGRGLICLAMTGARLDELDLAPMTTDNTALHGTAFTVSIDAKEGVTTGISAHDRAHTIKAAVDPSSISDDFARPGHVFPLRARPGGVLERRGQTEAAVDLAGLAGLSPAGVICEIVNDDGTMARVPDLIRFCKKHDLVMITVADLARYRFDADLEASIGALALCG